MNIQTTFDQHHGMIAADLDHALQLLDSGDTQAARALIAKVQITAQEQAEITDPRLYVAVRNLCVTRNMDSRRFHAMQQALGLREVVRSILMGGHSIDVIKLHTPIENDFFTSMIGLLPCADGATRIDADSARNCKGVYQNGNARRWIEFCDKQDAAGASA